MRRRLRKKLARKKALAKLLALSWYVLVESEGARWRQAPPQERVDALHALLFRIDFESYRATGKSVTGMAWRKTHRGVEPVYPRFPRRRRA